MGGKRKAKWFGFSQIVIGVVTERTEGRQRVVQLCLGGIVGKHGLRLKVRWLSAALRRSSMQWLKELSEGSGLSRWREN